MQRRFTCSAIRARARCRLRNAKPITSRVVAFMLSSSELIACRRATALLWSALRCVCCGASCRLTAASSLTYSPAVNGAAFQRGASSSQICMNDERRSTMGRVPVLRLASPTNLEEGDGEGGDSADRGGEGGGDGGVSALLGSDIPVVVEGRMKADVVAPSS